MGWVQSSNMVAPRGTNLVMKKRRMRDYSTDYTYGYTTGYLGMWLSHRMTYQLGLIKMMGEYAPALRMTVRMPRTEQRFKCAESYETCRASISARRVTRHAEPASVRGELRDTLNLHRINNTGSKFRKKKNGQGEMIRYLYFCSCVFYIYPHGPLFYLY